MLRIIFRNKMVFYEIIPAETKAYARLLRRDLNMSLRKIAQQCKISHSSVSRITTGPLPKIRRKTASANLKKSLTGRPKILSPRTERYLERELNNMQQNQGTFYVSDLMTSTGISSSTISTRSVRRTLNRKGYKFCAN